MKSFVLQLYDARHVQQITGVSSFVSEDATGSFGILPNHARFMTTLIFGLSRFRVSGEAWQYLAVPGAVLYFNNNELSISTRHFLIDSDYERISALLQQQLVTEEENLRIMKENLHLLEEQMLKRLWNIRHQMSRER